MLSSISAREKKQKTLVDLQALLFGLNQNMQYSNSFFSDLELQTLKLELILLFPKIIFLCVKLGEQHSTGEEGKWTWLLLQESLKFCLENKGEFYCKYSQKGVLFCRTHYSDSSSCLSFLLPFY